MAKSKALLSNGIKKNIKYNILFYGLLACLYLGMNIFEFTSDVSGEREMMYIYPLINNLIVVISLILLMKKKIIGIWLYFLCMLINLGYFIFDIYLTQSLGNGKYILIEQIFKISIIIITIINVIIMIVLLWKNRKRFMKLRFNEHYL